MSIKLHCDFCGKVIEKIKFQGEWLCTNDNKRYRFEVGVKSKEQTHFKKVDCCFKCMVDFFDSLKQKNSPVLGEESAQE